MKLEEHFRNKLKSHKVDWNKEILLDDLKKELSNEKRKFNGLWLFLFPLVLIVSVWAWNHRMGISDANVDDMLTTDVLETGTGAANSKHQDHIRKNNINENSTIEESYDEITKGEIKLAKSSNSANADLKLKKHLNLNNRKNSLRTSTLSNYTNQGEFEARSANAILEPNLKSKKSILSATQSDINLAISDIQNTFGKTKFQNKSGHFIKLDFVPRLETNLMAESSDFDYTPNLKALAFTPVLNKVKKNNPFYISGSTDIGLVFKTRNYTSNNTAFVERLKANEETETPLFTLNANFLVGYQSASGWSLESGLNYNEIREVFNYNETSSELIKAEEKIRYIIVDMQDTTFVTDSVNIVRTTNRKVKHYNKHRLISVPLQLGYRFNLNKARMVGSIGMNYNFAYKFQGRTNQIFENEGNEIVYNSLEMDFKLKNRIGLLFALAIEYPVMKQSVFFINSTFRRGPKLVAGIKDQNFNTLSLGLGLRVSLANKE